MAKSTHRQLRSSPCQIEVIKKQGERPYLKYYAEDVSKKNHPGGLRGRKIKQKVVTNEDHPEHYFVSLFKHYLALLPANPSADAFYLQPSRHPTSTYWFSATPLEHYSLGRTISCICKEADIGGYKTNHSLRAISGVRMSRWSWRGLDTVTWRVFVVTRGPQTHSAKHFLTS